MSAVLWWIAVNLLYAFPRQTYIYIYIFMWQQVSSRRFSLDVVIYEVPGIIVIFEYEVHAFSVAVFVFCTQARRLRAGRDI